MTTQQIAEQAAERCSECSKEITAQDYAQPRDYETFYPLCANCYERAEARHCEAELSALCY